MLALLMIGLSALPGCGMSLDDGEHDQRTFDVSGRTLTIDTNADLRLSQGDGDGVVVDRWLSGDAATSADSGWEMRGGALRLRADCGDRSINCGGRYEVAVPEGVGVVVTAGTSAVSAENLDQGLTVTTEGGDITVRNSGGALRLNSASGVTEVERARSAEVRVETNQGDIRVAFDEPPQTAEVSSRSGNVKVVLPADGTRYKVTARSEGGSVESEVEDAGSGSRSVSAVSRVGDVRVERS